MVPRSFKRATRLMVDSHNTKDDLLRFFGTPESKIDVVPLVQDAKFGQITDAAAIEKVRAKYGLPERFILYVGHLEPRKNLPRLVQAYIRLLERKELTSGHHLVILGKASFGYHAILDQVSRSEYGSRILFTGYVEDADVPAVYSLADVFAFPSLHEGFGIPVLEAMACGVPVVTSNCSALPEVAGGAALLVDPYDVDAIARGIAEVLGDGEVRSRLIAKGLTRVKRSNAAAVARAITAVYERAVPRALS
jgi:glycosyltransferase involved in cell wall biosynthesis